MISVMPVPLLAAHPRECNPQGRTRYVPSACACRRRLVRRFHIDCLDKLSEGIRGQFCESTARRQSASIPSPCCRRSAIISAITARLSMRAAEPRIPTGATGIIRSSSWRARPSASSALAASDRRRDALHGRWACAFWHTMSIRTTPGAPSASMSIWTRCLRRRT